MYAMGSFAAVADPNRRAILDALRERQHAVGELVELTGLSQPSVSKHLRVLRDAELVESRVDGKRRLYALRPDGLSDVDQWLAPYRAFWNERLDALERHLEEHP